MVVITCNLQWWCFLYNYTPTCPFTGAHKHIRVLIYSNLACTVWWWWWCGGGGGGSVSVHVCVFVCACVVYGASKQSKKKGK